MIEVLIAGRYELLHPDPTPSSPNAASGLALDTLTGTQVHLVVLAGTGSLRDAMHALQQVRDSALGTQLLDSGLDGGRPYWTTSTADLVPLRSDSETARFAVGWPALGSAGPGPASRTAEPSTPPAAPLSPTPPTPAELGVATTDGNDAGVDRSRPGPGRWAVSVAWGVLAFLLVLLLGYLLHLH